MPGYAEENLLSPYVADPTQTMGQINQATDRTVNQMNRFSEDQVAGMNKLSDTMAGIVPGAVEGYQQGQRHGQYMAEGQQRLQLGQQNLQRGAQALEEGGYRVRGLKRQEDWDTGDAGNGLNHFQAEEQAKFKHDTDFVPKNDQQSLDLGHESILNQRAQRGLAAAENQRQGQRFQWDKDTHDVAVAGENLRAAMMSGNQQAVEQTRGQLRASGLSTAQIQRAESSAALAIRQGQTTMDVLWNTSPEGQLANSELAHQEQQSQLLSEATRWAQAYHSARVGSDEADQAYQHLQQALMNMGPEGQAALDNIEQRSPFGGSPLFGLSVDTTGVKTRGDRIDEALQGLTQHQKEGVNVLQAKYQGAPSPFLQGRLGRISTGIDQAGNYVQAMQPGVVNLFGGPQGQNVKDMNKQFLAGPGQQQPQLGQGGGAPGAYQPPPAPTGQQLQGLYNAMPAQTAQTPAGPIAPGASANNATPQQLEQFANTVRQRNAAPRGGAKATPAGYNQQQGGAGYVSPWRPQQGAY